SLDHRYSRPARWDAAPTGLQISFIGIKGTEPIGGDTSVVFALDAGFDPYSFRPSSGPGSAHANAGTPQDQQTSWADSSRAGQWYNGNGYVGLSSPSYVSIPAELPDVRWCPRIRSDGRLLRLLAHRLAGTNLRRRQYRKLQAHDVAEISAHGGPGPRGGDLAVRWLRAEQRLQWRLPGRGGR